MSNGPDAIGSGPERVYGPPPPPIDKAAEEKKQVDAGKASALAGTKPPSAEDLKKISTDIQKTYGIQLPADMLDDHGNLKPDKLADASKFLAAEAAKRKQNDVGAAARLMQRAARLDPENKSLQLEAGRLLKSWADQSPKPEVKEALCRQAWGYFLLAGTAGAKDLIAAFSKDVDLSWMDADGNVKPDHSMEIHQLLYGSAGYSKQWQSVKTVENQLYKEGITWEHPSYLPMLIQRSMKQTAFGMLSASQQEEFLKDYLKQYVDAPNRRVTADILNQARKELTPAQKMAQYCALEGGNLEAEARKLQAEGKQTEADALLQKARGLYQAGSEIDPNNTMAQRHYGQYLLKEGKGAEAGQHFAQAIKGAGPEEVADMFAILKGHKDPTIFGGSGNAYAFVGDHLKDSLRVAEAREYYLKGARELADPKQAAVAQTQADFMGTLVDPARDYKDAMAFGDYSSKLGVSLDAQGYLFSSEVGPAKDRIRKKTEEFLDTPEMKKLRPGEHQFKKKLADFLGKHTEFPLLLDKEQAALLASGFKVGDKPFTWETSDKSNRAAEDKEVKACVVDTEDPAYFFENPGVGGRKAIFLKIEGEQFRERGQYAKSVASYQAALKENPDDPELLQGMAEVHQQWAEGMTDPAFKKLLYGKGVENLTAALAKRPKEVDLLQLKGELQTAQGDPTEARKTLEFALQLAKEAAAKNPEGSDFELIDRPGHGIGDGLVRYNSNPIVKSLQKAIDEEGKQLQSQRLASEPQPSEQLQGLMMQTGIDAQDVALASHKTVRELTPEDYQGFAFANFPKYRGEIEQAFGKLPFKDDGTIDPKLKEAADQYLKARDARIQDAVKKQGLREGTREYEDAVALGKGRKDDLAQAYQTLLDPKAGVYEKAASFLVSQAIVRQVSAQGAMQNAAGSQDLGQAFQNFQASGDAFKRAYALTGAGRYLRASAESFYHAAHLARKTGEEAKAKTLFLRGASVLQFAGTRDYEGNLFRDAASLRLIGDGLREAGRWEEAQKYYEAALPIMDASNAAAVHENRDPESKDRIANLAALCRRQVETEQQLGAAFFADKKALEEKLQRGMITEAERDKLSKMQAGVNLLKQVNGINYPGPKDGKEPAGIAKLRADLIVAVRDGDRAAFDKLRGVADQQVKNAEVLQMADALRTKTILPQMPPQVQEYIQGTGDWSILAQDYRGKKLPEDWNADEMNKMPVLQALRDWQSRFPDKAQQVSKIIDAFGTPELIPGLYGDTGAKLDVLNAKVKDLEGLLFKTDEQGNIPTDPTGQLRIFEPKEIIGDWLQATTELDLKDKPEAWTKHHISDATQSLNSVAQLLPSLETAKQECQAIQRQLDDAKKSGNKIQEDALSKKLDGLKGNIKEMQQNLGKILTAQVDRYGEDLKQYQLNAAKLGKLDRNGRAPFADALDKAGSKLKAAQQGISGVDADKDPVAALDEMIVGGKALAGAHAAMLKGLTFVNIAGVQQLTAGYMEVDGDFAGDGVKYHTSNTKVTKTWVPDAKWEAELKKIDAMFGDLSSLDGAGIQKLVQADQDYLKAGDAAMFKDLPTTLKEGIDAQLGMLEEMRKRRIDNGDAREVHEYDTLISKYQQAKTALENGNTDKALALFRVATESKRQSYVMKDFEDFNDRQKWKAIGLEVAIITAAALLTAASLGTAAPEAGVMATAGMMLVEGMVFTTFELGIKGTLYYGVQEDSGLGWKQHGFSVLGDPMQEIRGPGDIGWMMVKNAAMLGFLKGAGKAFEVFALGERALGGAGAKALLEDAAAVGARRAVTRQLLEAELKNLGAGGKVLYHAGAFATEAGAMQLWSSLSIPMDMLYERAAHGKKLEWKTFGEKLTQANSAESIEVNFINLVGLKLGGLVTSPISARLASDRQIAGNKKADLETLLKTKDAFEAKLQKKVEVAKSQGKVFALDPEMREEAKQLGKLIDGNLQAADQTGVALFTDEEKAKFRDVRNWLDLWVRHSSAEEKAQQAFLALEKDFKNGGKVVQVATADGLGYEMLDSRGRRSVVDKSVYDAYQKFAEQGNFETGHQVKGAMLNPRPPDASQAAKIAKTAGPLGLGLFLMLHPDMAQAATALESSLHQASDAFTGGNLALAALALGTGFMLAMPIFLGKDKGKTPAPNSPPFVPRDGVTAFSIHADIQGRLHLDPGINRGDAIMTFERGPGGQWYAFEGKPPKPFLDSQGDSTLLGRWKPVQDGDLYQIGDAVIPFQAPRDAWIPGYAPPGASSGVAPPPAVSGKLPVGHLYKVTPHPDGRVFIMGSAKGDLQFTDPSVAPNEVTFAKNPSDGKWYMKAGSDHVLLQGEKMPREKWVEIPDKAYFAINGAYFQFEVPPSPPAGPKVGDPVTMGYNGGNFEIAMPVRDQPIDSKTAIFGYVTRVQKLPDDPQGRFFVEVQYRTGTDPNAPQQKMIFNMKPSELTQLGLKFNATGGVDSASVQWLRIHPKDARAQELLKPAQVPAAKPPAPRLPPQGKVEAIVQDNAAGAPRRGVIKSDRPTEFYGTYSARTHEGVGYKDVNEDAVVQGANWALVLDGMGGHGNGDKASEIAGKAIADYLQRNLTSDADPKKVLADALIAGGDAVNATDYGRKGAGAVGVAHLVIRNPDGTFRAVIGHVGDAGAMVVGKDGTIKYRSKDQSLVQMKRDAEADALRDPHEVELEMRVDPEANVVFGTLGAQQKASPVVEEVPLEPGDLIVMFSDGIGDGMPTRDIAMLASGAKTADEAQEKIFGAAMTKMRDRQDAMEEFEQRRVPVALTNGKIGYMNVYGRVFDAAKGGTRIRDEKPTAAVTAQSMAILKPNRRLPVTTVDGKNAYIDKRGDIYDAASGGKPVDHYKPDNLTVHVYSHDLPAAT